MTLLWNRQLFDETYKFFGERYGLRQPANHIYLHYNWFTCGGDNARAYVSSSLVKPVGLSSGMRVLLVGSGFNWTGEILRDVYGIDVVGTDTSEFIVNNKDVSEESDLRDYITQAGYNPDTHLILGPPEGHQLGVKKPHPGTGELEWWINPLDLWLRERNGIASLRTSTEIAFEDATTQKSRNTIKRLAPDGFTHIISEAVLVGLENDSGVLSFCDAMEGLSSLLNAAVYHTVGPGGEQPPTHPLMLAKTSVEWRQLLDSGGFSGQKLVTAEGGVF